MSGRKGTCSTAWSGRWRGLRVDETRWRRVNVLRARFGLDSQLHGPWEEHRTSDDLPVSEIVEHLRGIRERSFSRDDGAETARLGERDRPRKVGHRRGVRAEIRFASVHEIVCGDFDGFRAGGDGDKPTSRPE